MKSIDIGILGYTITDKNIYNQLNKEIISTCDYKLELNNNLQNNIHEIIDYDTKILILFNDYTNIDYDKYDWIILCVNQPVVAFKWQAPNDLILNSIIPHKKLITINASIRNYQHITINDMNNFIVGTADKSADDILPKYINKPIQKNNLTIELKDTKIGNGYLHLRIFRTKIIHNFIHHNNIIHN
jgi:hypothetical protein